MAKFQAVTQDHVNAIMVEMQNETVTLEAGVMHYMQGSITVETKVPSLGGILKAGVTGETLFRPTYSGTGRIMLEPSFDQFFTLTLNNETLILDQGAFVACDAYHHELASGGRLAGAVGWSPRTDEVVAASGGAAGVAAGGGQLRDLLADYARERGITVPAPTTRSST